MKKLLFIPLILAACSKKETNGAEWLIQAQAPKASCETATLKGIDIAVCDVPGKDKVVQFVGAYQKGALPFQVYPLSDGTEKKEGEGQGSRSEPTPPATTPAPTPDAGSGSGQ